MHLVLAVFSIQLQKLTLFFTTGSVHACVPVLYILVSNYTASMAFGQLFQTVYNIIIIVIMVRFGRDHWMCLRNNYVDYVYTARSNSLYINIAKHGATHRSRFTILTP